MAAERSSFFGLQRHTLGGIVLIAVGVLLLTDTLDVVDLGAVLYRWWPLLLIGLGLARLVQLRSPTATGVWLPVVVGLVFLPASLGLVSWSRIWDLWPLALIAAGVAIALGWRGPRRRFGPGRTTGTVSENELRLDAVFASAQRKVTSQAFRGGEVDAVFGSADVDLREARMAAEGGKLDLSSVFAGIELRIPRDWNVTIHASNFLGSLEEKQSQSAETRGGPLVIDVSTVFGSVEIDN